MTDRIFAATILIVFLVGFTIGKASAQEVDFTEMFTKQQNRLQYGSTYSVSGENEVDLAYNFNTTYKMNNSFDLISTTKTVYDFQTIASVTTLGFRWRF